MTHHFIFHYKDYKDLKTPQKIAQNQWFSFFGGGEDAAHGFQLLPVSYNSIGPHFKGNFVTWTQLRPRSELCKTAIGEGEFKKEVMVDLGESLTINDYFGKSYLGIPNIRVEYNLPNIRV